MSKDELKENLITINRKVFFDYFVIEKYEAGIVLTGTEVKSLRQKEVSIKESFVLLKNEELLLLNMHINPYKFGNRFNHDPLRTRKLLLRKIEIVRLIGKLKEKGLTLIPTKIYFNKRGFAKVEIGLCKGKKLFDKRESIKRKESEKEIERAFKNKDN